MKKKIIIILIIDIIAIVAFVLGIYLLMFKELNQWQSNIATAFCVISLPVFFYSIFTQLAFKKYGDMQRNDEKRWDREEREEKEESAKM